MRVLVAVLLAGVLLAAAGCRPAGSGPAAGPLVVVSAPLASQPWVGRSVVRGAELARAELAQQATGRPAVVPRLRIVDNGASPSTAVAIARVAVREHAAALITDGTGALAVSRVTDPASLPVLVVFDGGGSFLDPRAHPSVFRLAPANAYLSRRLADYLAARHRQSVALVGDDSGYGRDGTRQLAADLAASGVRVAARIVLPAGGGAVADVSAQVLAARRVRPAALVVWAGAPVVAQVVRAARSTGWAVPVYAGPTGEDPLVRQQLADHPSWLDGATFVSFRITSEQGPAPFERFRAAYQQRYGADRVGVSAAGRPVLQPPDWAMFSHDSLLLVSAALTVTGGLTGAPLLAAVAGASVTGANGDQRGFGPDDREGVSSSDIYLARFAAMRFAAVTDDALSGRLPPVAQ